MANPLIGGKVLTVDPEANRLHEIGLRAELDGNFTAAHTAFAAASDILDAPLTVDARLTLNQPSVP